MQAHILTHGSQGMPMGPLTWANGRTFFWVLLGAVSFRESKIYHGFVMMFFYIPVSYCNQGCYHGEKKMFHIGVKFLWLI